MADNAAIEAAMAAAKARIEHSELPPGHSMSPGMQGVQGGLDKEEEADPDDLFNRLEKHTTKGIEAVNALAGAEMMTSGPETSKEPPTDLDSEIAKVRFEKLKGMLEMLCKKMPLSFSKKPESSTERMSKWFREMCAGAGHSLPAILIIAC